MTGLDIFLALSVSLQTNLIILQGEQISKGKRFCGNKTFFERTNVDENEFSYLCDSSKLLIWCE